MCSFLTTMGFKWGSAMNVRMLRITLFAAFVCALTFYGAVHAQSAEPNLKPAVQTITGDALSEGKRQGVADTASGIRPSGRVGIIETKATNAPRQFEYMMLRWTASMPEGTNVVIEARVSRDESDWSEWIEIHENHDVLDPLTEPNIGWSSTIYAGDSRYWQLRTTLTTASDGSKPELREIVVNTVDARNDVTNATKPSLAAPNGTERPAFISRASWGGSQVLNDSVGPTWYRANHLVVHHTADSNALRSGEKEWADRVRAEWSFHTYSRGWGDVGYNWLIDPNGVIYEGRNGSSSLGQRFGRVP